MLRPEGSWPWSWSKPWPSRVRVEARSTWSRGQRRVRGASDSKLATGRAMTGRTARQEGGNGSVGLGWSQGSHRGSMNTLGSSVTKNRRMVEWERRERDVRGRASAQRLTEKGQQGQDLKSVDIGAMAKADCASCWRDPGLEFSSPEVGPTSRPAFPGFLDHPCRGGVSPRMGRVYAAQPAATALLPVASALPVLAGQVLCQVRVPRTGPGAAGSWQQGHRAGRR